MNMCCLYVLHFWWISSHTANVRGGIEAEFHHQSSCSAYIQLGNLYMKDSVEDQNLGTLK